MMFDLAGRRAVVTGAGAGLGRAFALALSRQGAETICVDIDPAGLDETLTLLRSEGGSAFSVTADLADPLGAEAVADAIAANGGGLHILVNNAGIATAPGRTHEIAVADWDRALAVNLRSMFLVTRALLPAMMSTPGGSIINISSFLGLVGAYPGFPITAIPYAASKAGVVGFTRQLAAEYAPEGIRANAIAPGWHAGTNLGRERRASATPEQAARFDAFINGSVPLGRRGAPQDLDGLVVYLASDASSYMTGQVFAHDGGLTAV